jgi:hypothetical protein
VKEEKEKMDDGIMGMGMENGERMGIWGKN